jgi:hypothetical protein
MNNLWTLRKFKPCPTYPSITYFWVDEHDIVRFQREVSSLGFLPLSCKNIVGRNFHEIVGTRLVKSKATQEQLKQGWLVL